MIRIKINFIKLSPAENTTVLVNSYVPPRKYKEVAAKIMEYSYLNAEQVGFIIEAEAKEAVFRLEMAGGEFCGNGVLAAAALAKYLDFASPHKFKLEASGVDKLLECQAKSENKKKYLVQSTMPIDYLHQKWQGTVGDLTIQGDLIKLKGITHLIIDNYNLEKNKIEKLIKILAAEVKADAVGIIPYQNQADYFEIKPCVYVPEAGSLIFERGCGSGTLALGLLIAQKQKASIDLAVKQPGGVIKIGIQLKNKASNLLVEKALLENEVEITCEGQVLI